MRESKVFSIRPKGFNSDGYYDCIHIPADGGRDAQDAVTEVVQRMYDHGNPDGIFLVPGQYVVFADGQIVTFDQSDYNLLFERHQGEDPRRFFSIELRNLLKEFQDNPSLFQDETEKAIAGAVAAVIETADSIWYHSHGDHTCEALRQLEDDGK